MRYLLDTHTVLWAFNNEEKLSKTAVRAILDPVNEKYVSIASSWELAIKINLGKLAFDGGIAHFFAAINESGFQLLPIKETHVKLLETLPLFHRDPFDRMLVASAMAESMSLITADDNIRYYNVSTLW